MSNLILIPGLLCDERLWARQSAALQGVARCRVADVSPYESVETMAEAVMRSAPERFALAGFSLGGLVALEVFARARGRVTHLALLSTNVGGVPPQFRQKFEESIVTVKTRGLDVYLQEVFPRYMAPGHLADRALWQAFSSMGLALGPEVAVRQMRALIAYPGFGDAELAEIGCPTLLVAGREDQRSPVAAHEAVASKISGSQLRVIEDSGHFTPIESPDAVSAALGEWLRR